MNFHYAIYKLMKLLKLNVLKTFNVRIFIIYFVVYIVRFNFIIFFLNVNNAIVLRDSPFFSNREHYLIMCFRV